MKIVPFSRARCNLTDLINEVAYGGKHVVLTRKGKRVAAIVPLADLLELKKLRMLRAQKQARKKKVVESSSNMPIQSI
jgi:prevent-host-death family protein